MITLVISTAFIVSSMAALGWWRYIDILPSGHDSSQHCRHTLRIAESNKEIDSMKTP